MNAGKGDAVIELDGVEKRFPKSDTAAISGITARLRAGVVTGLVGPDGAGKTTLIRMLAGLLSASAGTIRVAGLDPIRDARELRGVVGYMPQKFGLYDDLSVRENLKLHADLRDAPTQAGQGTYGRLLDFTGLAQFSERRAGKLSGGMKQKLGLACALLGEPRVLLLDEPSVGVDPISRRELWKIVKALADEDGITVIWSTSSLDEAELFAEVLLLDQGAVLYSGNPRSLVDRVDGRCVQVRNIDGNRRHVLKRALLSASVSDGVIQGRSVRLVLRRAGEAPDLALLEAGPSAELVPVAPRLEDAVVDILGGGPSGESALAKRMAARPGTGLATVVEAKSLTRKFGEFVAANDISFDVGRGEVYGLLGPNGAGKSTTFRMLCGLLAPSGGTTRLNGLDVARSPGRARQQFGYMAQKFSLYGSLSVRQNLAFFSGIYGLAGAAQRERIREMVELFDLARFLDTTPEDLPLGFKQRLALACAIMHDPDILFLDEPTSGIDPISRREFWTHINGMADKGVTVMVTTHFMDEAEYCDRVGLVYRGKLIASGTPDDLRRKAASAARPDPSMEDAFIALIEAQDGAGT